MDDENKLERWSTTVSSSEDKIVRRAAANGQMSLSEYVVSDMVAAASVDLADRCLFTLSGREWEELQQVLNRPVVFKSRLAELLNQPSVLESD